MMKASMTSGYLSLGLTDPSSLHTKQRTSSAQDESTASQGLIYMLTPAIALTEPEQLNNLIQLSRGSFAASVWGHVKD